MDWKKKQYILRIAGVLLLIGGAFIVVRSALAPDTTMIVPTSRMISGTSVPPVDQESVGHVIVDKKTGREYISNQVIVEFNADVSEEDSLRILSEVEAKMLQRFTVAPLFLIQVTDSEDGKVAVDAVTALNKDPRVKQADLNYLTTAKESSVP